MPAVAQISVDFSARSEITNPRENTLPTNVKSINPLTLTQYLLYSRELNGTGQNFGLLTPSHLKYDGGFITAGNKINVKHNDLQLRQNLEVGNYVQTEFIISRTKEKNDNNYQSTRQNNTRGVTISPRAEDLSSNYFNIITDPTTRKITLYTFRTGVNKESSIIVNNVGSDVSITNKTDIFNVNAPSININNGGGAGLTTHTGPIVITGETTVNNVVNVRDNFNLGTTSYNKFNITASNGNVAFVGDLTINTNKFTVASASGNTVIAGTLALAGNFNIATNKFSVTSSNGNTSIAGTLNVTGKTTLSDDLEVTKNANIKTNLDVDGNTNIDGSLTVDDAFTLGDDLTINSGNLLINTGSPGSEKFKVLHASGNTTIGGTLYVTSTSQFNNSVSMVGGANSNAAARRITGVRRLVDIDEYNSTTYDNDAITVGDAKKFGFKKGMIMMWAPISPDNYDSNFNNSGLGIGVMTGWAVCNGNNSTPDLVDKFIIGGRASDGRTTIEGTAKREGGTTTHTHRIPAGGLGITGSASGGSVGDTALTNSQVPSHFHGIGVHSGFGNNDGGFINRNWNSGSFQHFGVIGDGFGGSNYGIRGSGNLGTSNNIVVANGSAHSHTFSNPSITITQPAYTTADGTHIPSYYSLIFIMKIS